MPAFDRADLEELAQDLRGISEDFADEIRRKPTLGELLELLTWGARALPDDSFSDVKPARVVKLSAQLGGGKASTENDVAGLNDNVFELATRWFGTTLAELRKRHPEPMTAASLGQLLLTLLRQAGPDLLSDVRPDDVKKIDVELKRARKHAVSPGDVVAIPVGDGAHVFAVVLALNRFGIAYGLFRGRYPLRAPSGDLRAAAARVIHSDDRAVAGGQWPVVGHDESLLSAFPGDPEIYHRPQPPIPGVPPVGRFGAAETSAGKLRDLTREEAERAGVLRPDFRQTHPSEILVKYLPKLVPRNDDPVPHSS